MRVSMDDPVWMMVCGAVTALLAIAVAWWVFPREPRCLRSHPDRRWVAYACEDVHLTDMPVGMTSVPITTRVCTEAHWEPVTVCDVYEVERAR